MTAFAARNTKASKLTATQVQEIREFYARGAISQGQLSRDYQVSIVTIGRIVRGEVWQNLTPREPTKQELNESAQRLLAIQQELEAKGVPAGIAKLKATGIAANETVNAALDELTDVTLPRSPLDE